MTKTLRGAVCAVPLQRLERLVATCGDDGALAQRIVDDATRLAHPGEMGGVYKALAITPAGTGAPPAF